MKSYEHITHACVIVYLSTPEEKFSYFPVYSFRGTGERDISQLHKSDITLSTESIFHVSVAGAMCAKLVLLPEV